MSGRLVCAFLLLALTTPVPTWSAQAQQKYDIALKKAVKGETLLIDKTDVEDTKMTVVDNNGKEVPVPNLGKKEYRLTYRQTILELPEGRKPTKLKRQYTKAEMAIGGQTITLPYQGQTLLIEKKENKYRFQIEGGAELTGKDAEKLDEEFNKENKGGPDLEKMSLPGRPVAVGDRWKVDTAPLVADLKREGSMVPDIDKFTVTGQLIKAYKKDGRQFGVLRIEMVMPIEELAIGGKEKKEMAKTPGSKLTLVVDMDLCIDGSANIGTVKGQVNMDLSVVVPGQQRVTVITRATKNEQRQLPR